MNNFYICIGYVCNYISKSKNGSPNINPPGGRSAKHYAPRCTPPPGKALVQSTNAFRCAPPPIYGWWGCPLGGGVAEIRRSLHF